jgi:hypothetical protein
MVRCKFTRDISLPMSNKDKKVLDLDRDKRIALYSARQDAGLNIFTGWFEEEAA